MNIKNIKRILTPKVQQEGGRFRFSGYLPLSTLYKFLSISTRLRFLSGFPWFTSHGFRYTMNSFPDPTLRFAPLPVSSPQPRRHPQAQQLCIHCRFRRREREEMNGLGGPCGVSLEEAG